MPVVDTHRSAPLFVTVAVVAFIALGAGACGSSGKKGSSTATTTPSSATGNSTGTTASTPPAAAGSQTIAIQNFRFNPDPLSTRTGKVTVINMDEGTPHSVTADDNSFDTDIFRNSDGPKTITLSNTGTI